MTPLEAFQEFTRRAEDGRIPNSTGSGFHSISANHRRVVLSHVRGALEHHTGKPRTEIDDLDIDLEPLAQELPDKARDYAKANRRKRPSNYRNSVQLFANTLFPNGGLPPQPRPTEPRHPDWDPVFTALENHRSALKKKLEAEGKDPKGRQGPQLSTLEQFRVFAESHGVRSPWDLPPYADVRQWARDDGLTQGQWDARVHAYRFATRLLVEFDYPELMRETWSRDRGIRSIPDLPERLRQRGCTEDPRNMTIVEILMVIAPRFGKVLAQRLTWGREHDRSEEWEKGNIGAVSRAVASMIRLGLDPSTRSMLSLFTEVVEVVNVNQAVSDLIAFELGGRVPPTRDVSLIQRVVDECRELGAALSPLKTRVSEDLDGEAPTHFVATIPRDIRYMFAMVRQVYERDVSEMDSDRWTAAAGAYSRALQSIQDHNDQLHLEGHIEKKLVAGYGELVCIALSKLRRKALAKVEQLDRFRSESKGRLHLTTVQDELHKIERRADTELENYIQQAVAFDDGLREKNYARALAGKHFVPKVITNDEGEPIGFEYVKTFFAGNDHQDVRLKMKDRKRAGRKRPRKRRRRLSRGMVDHSLLFRFWYETRPRNAVRRGLINSVEEFDFENDHYAVFIGEKAREDRRYRSTKQSQRYLESGRLTKAAWADRFTRTLKRMLKSIGVEVPKSTDPAFEEWRGILGPQIVRSVIATYWGGLRQEWALACFLTDDTKDMLEDHYVALKDDLGRLLRMDGPRNPRWFDTLLDQLIADKDGKDWAAFWDKFDPEDPSSWTPDEEE